MRLAVFVIGVLLVLGFGRLIGLSGASGILGGFAGVILCAVGAWFLWGTGAALLTGGLALSFWGSAVKGYGIDAPLIAHTFLFRLLVNYLPVIMMLAGIILLAGRWLR